MTSDDAHEFLLKLSFGKVAFIYKPSSKDEEGLRGTGAITGLSKQAFSITSSDGRGLTFPLDAQGTRFEDRPPMFLPKDARELVPQSTWLADGMLIIMPNGDTLFIVEIG